MSQETGSAAAANGSARPCRFCGADVRDTFVDLGMSPLANRYLEAAELRRMEPFYPLHAYVCAKCFLVQLEQFESPESIFGSYAYFSSYSDTWLEHARSYAAAAIRRFGLTDRSLVLEVASNDGYLLQYFTAAGIPVLGVEPAANVAEAAVAKGIATRIGFFGAGMAEQLAAKGVKADLVVANNVLAHVPALNDFVAGLRIVLKPEGVLTLEFPHLLRLIEDRLFDTIYHEHFSYFSFITATSVLAAHGLTVFDVDRLPTHGGSLRVYARHAASACPPISPRVGALHRQEEAAGLTSVETYRQFGGMVMASKRELLSFLIDAKRDGRSVVGYGAPAKASTLLNYCGVRSDLMEYTVDRSPHKQGRFLPGIHLPIYAPERIRETRPDYVLILPWNLKDEIMEQMGWIRTWGGRFVTPLPSVRVN